MKKRTTKGGGRTRRATEYSKPGRSASGRGRSGEATERVVPAAGRPGRSASGKGTGRGRSGEATERVVPAAGRPGRSASGKGTGRGRSGEATERVVPAAGRPERSGPGRNRRAADGERTRDQRPAPGRSTRRPVGKTSGRFSGGRDPRRESAGEQEITFSPKSTTPRPTGTEYKKSESRRATPSGTGRTGSRRSTDEASGKAKRAGGGQEGDLVRLNKFLADAGLASRRKADELIKEGVVRVNKEVVTEPGTQVHPSDLVTVNGEPVSAEKRLTYILLNKPKGYITTTSDERGRKTVMDIVHSRARIFPVGRLDRNTTGVLLFTNDGELANRLMHPRYEIARVYSATLDKSLLLDDAKKISAGVELEDGMTSPCSIVIDPKKKNKVLLEITEGRNREVRRIFEALGYEVDKLDRKMYANLMTRGMKRGEFRHLTRQEVRELEEIVGIKNRTVSTGQAPTSRAPGRRTTRSRQRR